MTPSPWSNEALAPSNSRDRGMVDTYHIITKLGVPECARTPLTVAVATDTGGIPMMVSRDSISTKQFDLLPVMDMSFKKDGVDYVDRVFVNSDPFIGKAYTYRCNGYYGAVGYMPKCQNLGVLEMPDPSVRNDATNSAYIVGGIPGLTNFNDYWGGLSERVDDSGGTPVAEPSLFLLLLAGLIAMLIFRRTT